MCGIVGIIGSERASYDIFRGLMALQHRGQDAAGILTFDGEELHIKKGTGLTSEVFDWSDLEDLRGSSGIGQVRYPTIGSTGAGDAQPFVTNIPTTIGFAHNGNVVNYEEIKRMLKDKGRKLLSTCDAEAILKLFASSLGERCGEEDIYRGVKKVMETVNGSYSALALVAGHGLLAFRDPHAIRPMVFGEKEENGRKSYIFASETVVLDLLGYNLIKNLEPGEAIYVDNNLRTNSIIIDGRERKHCMFEWVYFARADSVVEGISVYRARLNLGVKLAELFEQSADIVMPVPDTSIPSSIALAEKKNLRYREGVIKNRYIGRTFIMGSQRVRTEAVREKLNPMPCEVEGKNIAVVDDSIVRGTTSTKIVEMIKKSGAEKVHLLSTCPPIKHPCVYGIDFSTRGELIAEEKSIGEIRAMIGCDSLTYQTLDGLSRAIGIPEKNLCMACLNGEYPTDVSLKTLRKYGEEREKQQIP